MKKVMQFLFGRIFYCDSDSGSSGLVYSIPFKLDGILRVDPRRL